MSRTALDSVAWCSRIGSNYRCSYSLRRATEERVTVELPHATRAKAWGRTQVLKRDIITPLLQPPDTALFARCLSQGAFRSLAGGERSLSTLKSVLAEKIPAKQAELAKLKKEHGHKSVGEVGWMGQSAEISLGHVSPKTETAVTQTTNQL